jgi:hypothetical protein
MEIQRIYGHIRRIYSIWKSNVQFGPTLCVINAVSVLEMTIEELVRKAQGADVQSAEVFLCGDQIGLKYCSFQPVASPVLLPAWFTSMFRSK